MKSLKQRANVWFAVLFFVLGLGAAAVSHANPDDPLEQLLRQRQQSGGSDSLDALIRIKSAQPQATPAPQAAPSPRQQETPPQSASSNTRLRLSRSVQQAGAKHEVAKQSTLASAGGRGDADALLSNAMGLLGVAYRFGGTSPRTGFDCSGFMQHIFRKAFAVNLPRTSAQQAQVGAHVSRSNLQPGDMVFFRTSGRRISHVGMYVGNNRFIHAPRSGKRIEITNLGSKYWSARYATARRVKN
ncbi:C40 family peptidase [Conchiformibius kuhniae]|uniref:C40 family peptidase n=1 Tax=Conchiformibius kuhniae TaxID=211502 RepID=A0A8T9MX29_9NEIS